MASKYSQFLVSRARALTARWRVVALIANPKPIAVASNDAARRLHAEKRCLDALGGKVPPRSVMYVVRTRRGDGSVGMAKPCAACQKLLAACGIKRVYYSTNTGGWEVWSPKRALSA